MRLFSTTVLREGYAVVPQVFNPETASRLRKVVEQLAIEPSRERRGGVRGILHISPEILAVSQSREIQHLVSPILGGSAKGSSGASLR